MGKQYFVNGDNPTYTKPELKVVFERKTYILLELPIQILMKYIAFYIASQKEQ